MVVEEPPATFQEDIVSETHVEENPIQTAVYTVRTGAVNDLDEEFQRVWTYFVLREDLPQFLDEIQESDEQSLLDVYEAERRDRPE